MRRATMAIPDPGARFRTAALRGEIAIVEDCLARNADLLNQPSPSSGRTALHHACVNKQYAVIAYLCQQAEINAVTLDGEGQKPLLKG